MLVKLFRFRGKPRAGSRGEERQDGGGHRDGLADGGLLRVRAELSARGRGGGPLFDADGHGDMQGLQGVFETFDRLARGTLERAARLVVGDEVDFRTRVGGKTRELAPHFGRIVDAREEDVLDGEQTSGGLAVFLAGGEDLADVAAEFRGDEHRARLVVRGVKRKRQVPLLAQFGQRFDAGRPAAGGDGHAALGQRDPVRVRDHVQRGDQVVEVQERLADAHHDHVVRSLSELAAEQEILFDDLPRREVAREAGFAAGTEHAGDGAADLRAQAERHAAVFSGDAGTFHGLAVVKPQQILRGTVVGRIFRLDRDRRAEECRRKRLLRGRGKIRHERRIHDPFLHDPVVDLVGAVSGLSGGFQRRCDILFRGGSQIGLHLIRSHSRSSSRHRKAPS